MTLSQSFLKTEKRYLRHDSPAIARIFSDEVIFRSGLGSVSHNNCLLRTPQIFDPVEDKACLELLQSGGSFVEAVHVGLNKYKDDMDGGYEFCRKWTTFFHEIRHFHDLFGTPYGYSSFCRHLVFINDFLNMCKSFDGPLSSLTEANRSLPEVSAFYEHLMSYKDINDLEYGAFEVLTHVDESDLDYVTLEYITERGQTSIPAARLMMQTELGERINKLVPIGLISVCEALATLFQKSLLRSVNPEYAMLFENELRRSNSSTYLALEVFFTKATRRLDCNYVEDYQVISFLTRSLMHLAPYSMIDDKFLDLHVGWWVVDHTDAWAVEDRKEFKFVDPVNSDFISVIQRTYEVTNTILDNVWLRDFHECLYRYFVAPCAQSYNNERLLPLSGVTEFFLQHLDMAKIPFIIDESGSLREIAAHLVDGREEREAYEYGWTKLLMVQSLIQQILDPKQSYLICPYRNSLRPVFRNFNLAADGTECAERSAAFKCGIHRKEELRDAPACGWRKFVERLGYFTREEIEMNKIEARKVIFSTLSQPTKENFEGCNKLILSKKLHRLFVEMVSPEEALADEAFAQLYANCLFLSRDFNACLNFGSRYVEHFGLNGPLLGFLIHSLLCLNRGDAAAADVEMSDLLRLASQYPDDLFVQNAVSMATWNELAST